MSRNHFELAFPGSVLQQPRPQQMALVDASRDQIEGQEDDLLTLPRLILEFRLVRVEKIGGVDEIGHDLRIDALQCSYRLHHASRDRQHQGDEA